MCACPENRAAAAHRHALCYSWHCIVQHTLSIFVDVVVVAQVWPNTPQAAKVRPWHGPPLLTDKVVKLLR